MIILGNQVISAVFQLLLFTSVPFIWWKSSVSHLHFGEWLGLKKYLLHRKRPLSAV
jgi:hypothetical protein